MSLWTLTVIIFKVLWSVKFWVHLNFKRAILSQLTSTSFSLDGRSRRTFYRLIFVVGDTFPRPSAEKCTTSSAGLPKNWRDLLPRPPTALRWDREAVCRWKTDSVTAEDDLHVTVLDNGPFLSFLWPRFLVYSKIFTCPHCRLMWICGFNLQTWCSFLNVFSSSNTPVIHYNLVSWLINLTLHGCETFQLT